jgi:hypothetical protein
MRYQIHSLLCSFAIVPMLGMAAIAQDEKSKPAVDATTKPAVKVEAPATAKKEIASEKKADAASQSAKEAKTEKPTEKPADRVEATANKPEKLSPDSSKVTEESKEKKRDPKPAPKPAKPEPPEKKPLTNIGSLKHQQIPGQPWRVHDIKRPRPKPVAPGVINSAPPADAIVLFDGENLDQWYHIGPEEELYEAQWKVQDGYFEVEPRTGTLLSLDSFGSCQLHIEWMVPKGTTGTSQGRGNSGIKFMERYEVQVLDSFNNRTYADGQAASIYGQYPPLVNAMRPQGEWQTYDIVFEAPEYEAGKLKRPPFVTVFHNGILVQHHRELVGPTGLRGSASDEVPPAAPLSLQDHGNRIRFRNIWVRELP